MGLLLKLEGGNLSGMMGVRLLVINGKDEVIELKRKDEVSKREGGRIVW